MKLIVATIQTENWQIVQAALKSYDVYTMYISAVGDLQESLIGSYRGATFTEPRQRIRLEIVVMNDLAVQDIVEVVKEAAGTPNPQKITNGSIFVLPLDEWICIPADRPQVEPESDVVSGVRRQAS